MNLDLITSSVYRKLEEAVEAYCARFPDEDPDYVMGVAHDAMVKAAETYKESRGTKFLTWVLFLFRQELSSRGVRKEDSIMPLAEKRAERWDAIVRTRSRLSQTLLRSPTPAEVAEECGIELQEYFSLRDLCEGTSYVPFDEATEEDYEHGPSQDNWDTDGEELDELAIVDLAPGPAQALERLQTLAALDEAITVLPVLQRVVVQELYRHPTGEPPSQAELAKALGIDPRRVSEAAQEGVDRLRRIIRNEF